VIETVSARLHERFLLRDLAACAFMSPYHFHRVFRATTGVSPGRFVAALRIEEAKRVLLETELDVGEICAEVGYQSVGSFTSQFARLVGVAPSRYRELARDGFMPDVWELARAARSDGPRVAGTLLCDDAQGFACVGLFESALPEGRPAGCALAAVPGPYSVAAARPGSYYVFAALLPSEPPLLLHRGTPAGRSAARVTVAGDPVHADVRLGPRRIVDPPILLEVMAAADDRARVELPPRARRR
jgi:AraC-like DNA-binding protein